MNSLIKIYYIGRYTSGNISAIYLTVEHDDIDYGILDYPVHSQVMDCLDRMDKRYIMNKYDMDIIIGYEVVQVDVPEDYTCTEVQDFLQYIYPIACEYYTVGMIGFVITKMKDVIFGRGFSNIEKAEIVVAALGACTAFTSEVIDDISKNIGPKRLE